MGYILWLIAIFLSFNTLAQSKGDLEEMVRRSHQSFIDGILAEDFHLVNDILADDVTLGTPGGGFGTKQGYVNALKNGMLFYDSATNHSFNVRIYGTTGLVNGNVDLVFRYKDENNEMYRMLEHLTFTAVYAIDKKSPRMVAWQSNRPTTDSIVKIHEGTYEIYALEYAKGDWKPLVSEIAVGSSVNDTLKGNFVFWLLKNNSGKNILVDAGFVAKETNQGYTRPDSVLQKLNIKPEEITDIILTHPHWDHIGGIHLFPNAMVWIQEADFNYFVGKAWQQNGFSDGFDKNDVPKIIQKNLEGKLTLVKGDSLEIIPDIRVFVGSKHSWESQYVLVNGTSGNTIIASDNIWFYANLDYLLPIPHYTFDPVAYVN